MEPITYTPIGVIETPHREPYQTPIQPVFARGVTGRVVLLPEYAVGLRDLSGFTHIHLIYAFRREGPPRLLVQPYLQDQTRGVFSTRAVCRPNPIGLSLVKLNGIEGHVLHVEGVDVLDGTPLLDIKPYIRRFDERPEARCGWQDTVDDAEAEARGRRER